MRPARTASVLPRKLRQNKKAFAILVVNNGAPRHLVGCSHVNSSVVKPQGKRIGTNRIEMAANGRKSISNCRFQILNFRSLPSHKAMLYGRFIVFRSGRFALHPYDCALCHPLAHARPLTRLTGFRFVLFLYAGFRRCRGFTTALLLCHPAIRRGFQKSRGFAAGNIPPAHPVREVPCTHRVQSSPCAARSSGGKCLLLPLLHYARRAFFAMGRLVVPHCWVSMCPL